MDVSHEQRSVPQQRRTNLSKTLVQFRALAKVNSWANGATPAIPHNRRGCLQAVTEGLAAEKELREIAEGWRRWATHPDAWYAVLHGEIL
jgi:hypothetical protein